MPKANDVLSAAALKQFNALISSIKGLERKGASMPYTSLNGHMFAFLDRTGSLGLRLEKTAREKFLNHYHASLCEAHGTVLKEYVAVPDKLFANTRGLKPWFRASYDYVKSLKPKATARKK